jgi:hypothetical protein
MEKIAAAETEKGMMPEPGLEEPEKSTHPSSKKQKRIELGVMVGAGTIAGMMLGFALCGSLTNLEGMLGGALTGLIIYYFS